VAGGTLHTCEPTAVLKQDWGKLGAGRSMELALGSNGCVQTSATKL